MADVNKSVEVKFESNADQVKSEVDGLLSSLDKTSNEYEELERSLRDVVNAEQKLIQSEQKLTEQLGRTKGATASIEEEVRKNTIAYQNKVRELDNVRQRYSRVDESSNRLSNSTQRLTSSISSNGGAMGLLGELFGPIPMIFKDASESAELFGIRLTGIRGAIVTTGIGVLVIAVGLLIENWDKVSEAIGNTSEKTKALKSINEDLTKGMTNVYTELSNVKVAFDRAKQGAISKEEALQIYNDTLGDTIGKANTLDEAEKLYASKTGDYIKATQLRMTAQLLLAKAAEESAKISTGEAKTVTLTDKLSNIWKYYTTGVEKDLTDLSNDNIKRTENDIKTYTDLAKQAEKEANELDKKSGIRSIERVEIKKTELTEEQKLDEARKKQAQEIANQAQQDNLKNSQTEYEQLEEKYKRDKALLEKYKIDTTELEKKYMNDVNNLRLKDSEAEKKRNGDKLKSLTDLLDKSKQKELEYKDLKTAEDVEDFRLKQEKIITDAETERILKATELGATEEQLKQIRDYYESLRVENNKTATDTIKMQEDVVFKFRMDLWNKIGTAIGALGGLFKQHTAAAKVLALTEIAIGTATGFINALNIAQESSTGPGAAFAFPIFYASQVASVLGAAARAKAVLSSGGSGGGGGTTAPSIPASAAPNVSFVSSNENQIANTIGDTNRNAEPIRAYVVSGDVTTAQSLDRNIINNSSLG